MHPKYLTSGFGIVNGQTHALYLEYKDGTNMYMAREIHPALKKKITIKPVKRTLHV